jgi:hypothetical protein
MLASLSVSRNCRNPRKNLTIRYILENVYHEYRILSEIPDTLPCFDRHIGLVGGAEAKIFLHFVEN